MEYGVLLTPSSILIEDAKVVGFTVTIATHGKPLSLPTFAYESYRLTDPIKLLSPLGLTGRGWRLLCLCTCLG